MDWTLLNEADSFLSDTCMVLFGNACPFWLWLKHDPFWQVALVSVCWNFSLGLRCYGPSSWILYTNDHSFQTGSANRGDESTQ